MLGKIVPHLMQVPQLSRLLVNQETAELCFIEQESSVLVWGVQKWPCFRSRQPETHYELGMTQNSQSFYQCLPSCRNRWAQHQHRFLMHKTPNVENPKTFLSRVMLYFFIIYSFFVPFGGGAGSLTVLVCLSEPGSSHDPPVSTSQC